ncbi:MAG TPA: nucleotidyltransferase family protein [Solirubrobacteraceae bacterium]|jgi:hypothetical protein|nr:nucleotidyltransferase family protein [Solirubrobacteraceae bacterium]
MPVSDQRFVAATLRLIVDDGTVVVTTALEKAAVPTILLKGPALAERLYVDPESRTYLDTDLLVPAEDLARAGATLCSLGYGLVASHEVGGAPVGHAQTWSCGRHVVDLHVRLPGTATAGAESWPVLSARTRPTIVRGHRLLTLDDGAAALLLALHVAHHGPTEFGQACEDLRRGIERFGPGTWEDAAVLARRLGAEGAIGWGLRLVPGGEELAVRLGLPATPTPSQFVLASGRRPHITAGLEEIASASGWGARARILVGKLFPSALVLRAYGAGPERWSLAAAWLRRARLLARHSPAGTRDFFRVLIIRRRQLRRSPSGQPSAYE